MKCGTAFEKLPGFMILYEKGGSGMPKKKSGLFDNKKYQNEYHKAMKTKLISFNPGNPEDMRLWEYLQTKENQTGYIKKLIREDIEKI